MESAVQCFRCQAISDAMQRWQYEYNNSFRVELGTFGELESDSSCKTCQAIAEYFRTEEDPSSSYRLYFGRLVHKQRFWIRLTIDDPGDGDYGAGALELIPPPTLDPTLGHYVELDPYWIDISRIYRWPASCDIEHQGVCHTFPAWKTLDRPPVLILIDVESWRLSLVKPVQYIALSYVWGRIPNVLETTKANFQDLQQPGALASPDLLARLPRTVRDAIVLTKAMSQRYLWVDRLCIVQDDFENKKEQLDNMASIYARSYFTIVAADGSDADYGLRGVPGTASPRSCRQQMYHFSKQCSMMKAPIPEEKLDTKDWHRRGWTFQERTLSNRNLVFFQDQVFWECRSSVWIEDIADIPEGANPLKISKRKRADRHDLQFLKWPDLHQYANLVQRYNYRLLSFHSDALNAFSAVLQVLSRSFPGGFLYGLPEFFFDFALLWIPIFPQKQRKHQFPSWSWLSYEGDMSFMYFTKCDKLVFNSTIGSLMLAPGVELYPMVDWYKTSETTGQKHRIDNSYYRYQKMRNDYTQPLPPGWSRHIYHQSHPDIRSDQEDVVYFRHAEAWGERFIYPVPMPDEPLVPKVDSWGAELTFTTVRRYLVLGPEMKGHIESGGHGWSNYWNAEVAGCITFSLLDDAGNWVGMIRSNTSGEGDALIGENCEIIVTSSGVAYEDSWGNASLRFMELVVREELKDTMVYEFYNVLWIKREHQVAYRKGAGRVWKPTWEKEHSERADIVLG
ncbi:HET-domain-containing protein [Lindgomyces ingoldianus]|uniref:HET-domain-containing protein n=1 Tax=Lindgomyces ingoldianus TaxID=673940 RepID=A0ACB6QQM8_9PLEO|nr:HET-domain-containing protein [Lindgomyces ingoldianus]KAF2469324.1 HET-domain-containing protein [Lindgomyces ingoldianus]